MVYFYLKPSCFSHFSIMVNTIKNLMGSYTNIDVLTAKTMMFYSY